MPKLNFIWFYLSHLVSSVIVSKGREGIVGKSPSKIYHVSLPILFPLRERKISSPPAAPPTLILIYTRSYSYIHICPIIKNNSSLKLQFKPLINQILPWPDHGSCFSIDSFLFSIVLCSDFYLLHDLICHIPLYFFSFFFLTACFLLLSWLNDSLLLYFQWRTHIWKIAKEQ